MYGYYVTLGGQRIRKSSGEWTTRELALEALEARIRAAGVGLEPQQPKVLREVVDEYLKFKEERGKRSLREDRRILKTRILPAFGAELPIRSLTTAMIGQYERGRAGQVTSYTVANELTVLRHMLRLARRWGYVQQVPEIELPKKPEGRTRYLTEDEITKLQAACAQSKNRHLGVIVSIALNTGMRKAEIMGLVWERVDLASDYGLSARLVLYKTKSGKPRGIPLNQDATTALAALEPDPEKRIGPVFKRWNGAQWGAIRTAWESALTRAGIEGVRFHDLRHSFASHYMMRGGSLYDLKEILGHSDIKMTARYSHLSPSHLRVGVDRLKGLAPAPPTAHPTAHSAKLSRRRRVSPDAPVAQVDRAAVS
jgi:integrase